MAKRSKSAKKNAPKKSSAGSANAAYKAVIDDLVAGNRILYNEGVVDGFGHISARDPRDPEPLPDVAGARAGAGRRRATSWRFGMDGEPVSNDGRSVYSERFIHSEIYKARPDVNSVVHTHSPTVVPFSVTNEPLRPIRAGFFYPEVPVFDTRDAAGWTDLLISNQALGKALAEKLGNNSVVLLRGHGNAVVGTERADGGLPRGLHRGQRQAAAAGEAAGRADQLSGAGRSRDHGRRAQCRTGPGMAPTASGSS